MTMQGCPSCGAREPEACRCTKEQRAAAWERGKDGVVRYMSGIKIVVWPKGEKIFLRRLRPFHLVPTEFHFLEDGALDDRPSLAILMEDAAGNCALGEISLAMLEPVLAQCAKMKETQSHDRTSTDSPPAVAEPSPS